MNNSLLGQEVIVTLQNNPLVVARGLLLAWDDGGEAVIQDEMGFVHHCWPMLHVERV